MNWGYAEDEDNLGLSKHIDVYVTNIHIVKTQKDAEECLREFMRRYIEVGVDPHGTTVRDNVEFALLLHTPKQLLTESRIEAICQDEISKSLPMYCVVQ